MTLRGDLATLELADLVQNLEVHRRSGVLTIEGADGTAHLGFVEGKLALFARDGRASLPEALVHAGLVSAKALEASRKKRKLTRKSLGATLVAGRRIKADALTAFAYQRLLDEACELVATRAGAFTFTEGTPPAGTFDPEEARLELRLAAGPLLMESARREDHWRLIRRRVPSDAAHYRRARPAEGLVEPELLELAQALGAELDGSASVAEVMERFPHRRFEAYGCLAQLCERHVVELVQASDLAALAREHAATDPELAREFVERGLREHPQDKELLTERARIAERDGDPARAAECLKLLVPLHLEAGERAQAQLALVRAKRHLPKDTSLWERSLQLALEDDRRADALADGRRLVELYLEPGLFARAAQVLEELLRLEPDSWELSRDLARARASSGDLSSAVRLLEELARAALSAGAFPRARVAYEEVLSLDPRHARARETLEELESGALQARRERRARWLRRSALALASAVLLAWLGLEAAARHAFAEADQAVWTSGALVTGELGPAIARYEEVAARYPLASTAWFDVRRRVRELEELQRERERDAGPSPGRAATWFDLEDGLPQDR